MTNAHIPPDALRTPTWVGVVLLVLLTTATAALAAPEWVQVYASRLNNTPSYDALGWWSRAEWQAWCAAGPMQRSIGPAECCTAMDGQTRCVRWADAVRAKRRPPGGTTP